MNPPAPQRLRIRRRRPDYLGPLPALGFCLSHHGFDTRPHDPKKLGVSALNPPAPQRLRFRGGVPITSAPSALSDFALVTMTSIPAPVTSKNSASRRLGGKSPRPPAPQNQKRRPDYLGPLRALGFCLSPHDFHTRPPRPPNTPRLGPQS